MSLDTHLVPALSAQQRHCHALLMLYAPLPQVSLETIGQINGVDILITQQDIIDISRKIKESHKLNILLKKNGECHLQGEILNQRLCLLASLRRALRISPQFIAQHFTPWLDAAPGLHAFTQPQKRTRKFAHLTQRCARQLNREFNERDIQFLSLYWQFFLWQHGNGITQRFNKQQQQWLREKPEYNAANTLFNELQILSNNRLTENERDFFTLVFCLLKNHSYENSGSEQDQRLQCEIERLVANFQHVSGMRFSSDKGLTRQLFAHLGPAIERCRFDIGVDSSLQDEVARMYPRLMRTTQEALQDLQDAYQVIFSAEEVGLIAVSFGAWLMQGNALQEKQIMLLTNQNPELEQAVEQQIREATLLPLNIKYQTLAEFYQYGAPGGIAMIVTPYPTKSTDADPLVIHTQLPLAKEQRKRIRSLLES